MSKRGWESMQGQASMLQRGWGTTDGRGQSPAWRDQGRQTLISFLQWLWMAHGPRVV